MSFVVKIKSRVMDAIKNKREVERDVLRVVLGEIQTLESRDNRVLSDEQVASIIRKTIQSNEEILGYDNLKESTVNKLTEENQILKELLPKTLSKEEIRSIIEGDKELVAQIREANSGKAIGLAMKHFKSSGTSVLGEDVKEIVLELTS